MCLENDLRNQLSRFVAVVSLDHFMVGSVLAQIDHQLVFSIGHLFHNSPFEQMD